jgi:uncharacterized protein YukE
MIRYHTPRFEKLLHAHQSFSESITQATADLIEEIAELLSHFHGHNKITEEYEVRCVAW